MRPSAIQRLTATAILAATVGIFVLASPSSIAQMAAATPAAGAPKGIQAVTKPSRDVTISFVHPGRVLNILVDVGEDVKAGQVLAQQDDAEERAALAIDESKANDETTIAAQEAIRDQAQNEMKRMEDAATGVGVSELEKARLEYVVDVAKVAISKVQHTQDQLKFKQSAIALEKLKIIAPVDGVIAQRMLEAGESADGGNMKALRIVQLDPLRVEVPVPTLLARKLKKDDAADVTFSDGVVRQGKVAIVFPVGDAASNTIMVRIEVPNKDKLQSGEKVFVNFSAATAAVAAKP